MQRNVQLNVDKEFLDVKDLAEILDIGKSLVYKLVRQNMIPHVRIGSSIKFVKSQIEDWLGQGGTKEEVV